ncbi:MAG: hypothetical protein EBR30_15175 [Cytophagia bacterium]|nr:hypothetical protein [Cytophagia bacterium]NBW36327.1 hypothetical protein [Cytophagia bacterium]
MKRILIGLLIVILGLTCINLYKRFTEDSDFKVKFHIYSQRTREPLEILFRNIPTLYDTMIDVEIVEPYSKELNLYRVNNDIYGGTPDIHYIVYDKDNRQIIDLKSDLLAWKIKDIENAHFDTLDSYFIDIVTFRQIFESRLTTREEIADKYAELLTNTIDTTYFKRIKQRNDIEIILSSHRKTQFLMIDEEKTIKDFDFVDNLGDNEFLYWFYDKGLIKIQVDFNDGHLTNVKTLRLGDLGVEITHL